MSDWARAGLSASISGSIASIVSTATLAALARAEGKGALQPTNSTSHWLHGSFAGQVREMDVPHTLTGYATHHASAIFWAFPFERWLQSRPPRSPGQMLIDAAGMSVIAAAVDYGLAPKRFTPGWEDVLSVRSIGIAYGALALGLAAGALVTQSLRAGSHDGGRRQQRRSDARFASRSNGGARPSHGERRDEWRPGGRDERAYGQARSNQASSSQAYSNQARSETRQHDHGRHDREASEKLYSLIDDIRICMMSTTDEKGAIHSRPMYALKPDESGDLWFFTRSASPKVREFGPDGKVNLAFSHPGKQHYVSIAGRAELVRDKSLIAQKWSEPMRTWFPQGKDDPQLALVRVHPEAGEYWDSPSGAVKYLYGYAKASLTGESPHELADTRKVDMR